MPTPASWDYSVFSLTESENILQMGQPRDTYPISVAIPAYSRCQELEELLQSIYDQTLLPSEITICEDLSPERERIREIAEPWRDRFAAESCVLNFFENEKNLGYDKNIRRIIEVSNTPWVMLIGNDDLLLPNCIECAASYLAVHQEAQMVSRAFVIFSNNLDNLVVKSQLSLEDITFTLQNSSPGIIMRTCGFVGGLIVNREWANSLATERFDGSLYYQIYLGAVAYCQHGIGYISHKTVAARSGNPPLFGSASAERDVHIPGSYTPKGRAKMWAATLNIADEVGRQFSIQLLPGVKRELEVRQSFHIFEMMSSAKRKHLQELRHEFEKLGLFSHPLPRALYTLNFVLGGWSKYFYRGVRAMRRWKVATHA